MLQLGWKAGTEQYPPGELLEYAVAAEQAGFDSIDASDHFHPWAEKGQACFVWTWLGAAAARTHKIMLGTGITCPIFRYHPAVAAQMAATLACLAPGRSYLGVGTGEALNEYSATAEWPDYKIRRERLAEAIELMRKLWTGEKVTHRGVFYQTRQAKLYTLPDQPIPIFISSMAPGSARFAGRHGDALITVGGEEPETYRKIFENFDAGAREAGKDPAKMPRMIELGVAYTDDEEKAIEIRKEYWAGTFIPALFVERIYTPKMSEDNGKAVGSDTVKQAVCISARAEDHVKYARKYIDLGFDHLIFHSAGPDQRAFIQGYGRDVLPKLRRAHGGEKRRQPSAA
ncbi:MAG TPA: TIGR03557 family F420-dependent LLM class oxidoreductase [Candidatus Binatia bacterium]